MIAIVNVSPEDTPLDGVNDYELRINKEVKATFQHNRKYGLADCLRQAADAFEQQEKERSNSLFDKLVLMYDEIK